MATIATISTVEEATDTLNTLARDHDWVSVFWDRGWGDSGQTAGITGTVDGNGQAPLAEVPAGVYRELLDGGHIAANSLRTYKARRNHDFVAVAR